MSKTELITNVHSRIIHNSQKADKCVNTMWYIYTLESYLAIKRNKIPIHAKTWMNLKYIMVSDVCDQKTIDV